MYALAAGVALIGASALFMVEMAPRPPRAPGAHIAERGTRTALPPDSAAKPLGADSPAPVEAGLAASAGTAVANLRPPASSVDDLLVDRMHMPELRAEAPAAVESIASSTAEIISIKVGEMEQGDSDVVLIVDQRMDI